MCVIAGGRMFVWGKNDCGQVGAGDTENRAVPTLVAEGGKADTGLQG